MKDRVIQKRVVLYGLGKGCSYVRKQLLPSTKVIAYCDSFANIDSFLGIKFVSPKELNQINFDYIIITIIDKDQALIIEEYLRNECYVNKQKIISYFRSCNTELIRNKMGCCNPLLVDTIVFGNSHAQMGLIEDAFPKNTINLSTPGADIFIMYRTLKDYITEFKNVKKIIIDLFDYTVFNIDASRTHNTKWVYLQGAYLVSRNIRYNPAIAEKKLSTEKEALEYFMLNINGIDITKKEIMSELFNNTDLYYMNDPKDNWHHITKKDPLNSEMLSYRIDKRKYIETINNNTELLDKMIKICEENDIEVILTLLPQYYLMEKCYVSMNDKWRPMFNNIINKLESEHSNIKFYNFTNEERISRNEMFYCDSSHLNTVGGYAMTEILCNKIYQQ